MPAHRRRLVASPLVLALVAALGLATAACSPSPDVAATVDGVEVTADEVTSVAGVFRMLSDANGSPCGSPVEGETAEAACARYALTNLLRIRIAEEWAADNDVSVPETDVEDVVSRLDQDLAPDGLDATAERYDITREDVAELARGLLLFGAVRTAVAEQQVSDDELRAEYDASTDFTQIHAKHILVADQATAEEVYAKATAENFGDLATQYSTDTVSAQNGGDLGLVVQTQFDQTFAEAALALEPGQIGTPVKTQFGWHVILLVEVVRTPFESAKPSLLSARAGEIFATWLPERFAAADIVVNPTYGSLDAAAAEVVAVRSTATTP